ncbi:MAG: Shikimate dh protein [Pseudomonadota bacterium]|nr:Shikimate dh protein [Pseudomonadota bacterium]
MHISGQTRVFMVIGDPVAQVRAPALFNRIFAQHDIDAVLVPARVPAGRAASFAREVLGSGSIAGLWATVPHKPALLPALAGIDRHGRRAGSVNAVRRAADGTLEGALFDGLGLVDALRHHGIALAGRRVLLLGAGGAGAAIAAALLDTPIACLSIHDLGDRAERLVERLQSEGCGPRLQAAGADPADHDLIIQATPLGMRPEDPLPLDVARIAPGTQVFDILMKSATTPLMRACAARGIEAHPGFEMLVQQVPAYLEFFGLPEVARAMRADLSGVRQVIAA